MAESQNARELRREVEAQTRITQETRAIIEAQASDALTMQLEASRESIAWAQVQAAAAARTEALAEETYLAQERQNERTKAHQFSMWLQGTENGADYSDWLSAAIPIQEKFLESLDEWEAAKAADIIDHVDSSRAEAQEKFDLDDATSQMAAKITDHTHKRIMEYLLGLAAVWAVWTALVAYASRSIMSAEDSYLIAALMGIPLSAIVLVDLLVFTPRARAYRRRVENANDWVSQRKAEFAMRLPKTWAPGDDWSHLELLSTNIDVMPDHYLNFKRDWMVEIPKRLPRSMDASLLPKGAKHSKAFLDVHT